MVETIECFNYLNELFSVSGFLVVNQASSKANVATVLQIFYARYEYNTLSYDFLMWVLPHLVRNGIEPQIYFCKP